MVISQSGNNVIFTIEGGIELDGSGSVNGNKMNLTVNTPDIGQITILISFSDDGQSFYGTLESNEFQGTITGTKSEWEIYDVNTNGIPQFVSVDYIELAKIGQISKFRSSVGHDYSDDFESCRSMKHYLEPKSDIDWSTIKIFSPVGICQ